MPKRYAFFTIPNRHFSMTQPSQADFKHAIKHEHCVYLSELEGMHTKFEDAYEQERYLKTKFQGKIFIAICEEHHHESELKISAFAYTSENDVEHQITIDPEIFDTKAAAIKRRKLKYQQLQNPDIELQIAPALVNKSQSTHTNSIYQSVSNSLIALNARYGKNLKEDECLEGLINFINTTAKNWLHPDHRTYYTAKWCLHVICSTYLTTEHYLSKMTVKRILALVWRAANDRKKLRCSIAEATDAIAKHLSDTYDKDSDSSVSIEHINKNNLICLGGIIEKLATSLSTDKRHPDVNVSYIDKTTVNLKATALIVEALTQYIHASSPQHAQIILNDIEQEKEITDEQWQQIWPQIKMQVATVLHQEFDEFVNALPKDCIQQAIAGADNADYLLMTPLTPHQLEVIKSICKTKILQHEREAENLRLQKLLNEVKNFYKTANKPEHGQDKIDVIAIDDQTIIANMIINNLLVTYKEGKFYLYTPCQNSDYFKDSLAAYATADSSETYLSKLIFKLIAFKKSHPHSKMAKSIALTLDSPSNSTSFSKRFGLNSHKKQALVEPVNYPILTLVK